MNQRDIRLGNNFEMEKNLSSRSFCKTLKLIFNAYGYMYHNNVTVNCDCEPVNCDRELVNCDCDL